MYFINQSFFLPILIFFIQISGLLKKSINGQPSANY